MYSTEEAKFALQERDAFLAAGERTLLFVIKAVKIFLYLVRRFVR